MSIAKKYVQRAYAFRRNPLRKKSVISYAVLSHKKARDVMNQKPCEIRIRFNTDYKKCQPGLVWRILIENAERDEYDEFLASGFSVTGSCRSTFEHLPEVGDKWHVGCRGTYVWDGDTIHITSIEV